MPLHHFVLSSITMTTDRSCVEQNQWWRLVLSVAGLLAACATNQFNKKVFAAVLAMQHSRWESNLDLFSRFHRCLHRLVVL